MITIKPNHTLILVKLVGLDDRSGGFFERPFQTDLRAYNRAYKRLLWELDMEEDDDVSDLQSIKTTEYCGITCHTLHLEFQNMYYFEVPNDQPLELQFNNSDGWNIRPTNDEIVGVYVYPDQENDPKNRDWGEYIRFAVYTKTPVIHSYYDYENDCVIYN